MKKRSRAHEAGSIEAGSSISKSFFFANRVDGVIVGSQIEPAWAPRSAQSSQIEPARAAGAARSSQTKPNRASKGARGSQSEPIEARSSQQGRPGRARGAQAAPAGRPAVRANPPARPSWTARRAISLWIKSLDLKMTFKHSIPDFLICSKFLHFLQAAAHTVG